MKVTTSLIPEFVFYRNYSDCTIEQALLHAFFTSENNTLTLPEINKIKVNWNSLVWSYWSAIRYLRKKGYNIVTTTKHLKNHITISKYELKNPTFSGSITD